MVLCLPHATLLLLHTCVDAGGRVTNGDVGVRTPGSLLGRSQRSLRARQRFCFEGTATVHGRGGGKHTGAVERRPSVAGVGGELPPLYVRNPTAGAAVFLVGRSGRGVRRFMFFFFF